MCGTTKLIILVKWNFVQLRLSHFDSNRYASRLLFPQGFEFKRDYIHCSIHMVEIFHQRKSPSVFNGQCFKPKPVQPFFSRKKFQGMTCQHTSYIFSIGYRVSSYPKLTAYPQISLKIFHRNHTPRSFKGQKFLLDLPVQRRRRLQNVPRKHFRMLKFLGGSLEIALFLLWDRHPFTNRLHSG